MATRLVLQEIEVVLKDHSFARVHRSYLVNLNEVGKCKRRRRLSCDKRCLDIDVSGNKKEALLKKLLPNK